MKARPPDPVVVADPAHLLCALAMLVPRNERFPETILRFAGGWAAAEPEIGRRILGFAEQCHWTIVPDPGEGTRCPTTALLDSSWSRCDPLDALAWAGPAMAAPSEGPWAFLDPMAPRMKFLLGARDGAGAQRILDALGAYHLDGIRGIPLRTTPASSGEAPFRFFWDVSMERPHPFVFQQADRVWWNPSGSSLPSIYFEYPWRSSVPIEVLERMPWSKDAGVVLLGHLSPRIVEVGLSEDGNAYAEFPGLVRLEKGRCEVHPPVVLPQAVAETVFRFEIRGGGPDPRRAATHRIEVLRNEIDAKQKLLEDLIARAPAPGDDLAPEPLFLHAQAPHERGHLPIGIQRLMVEWADQPEDLGSVAYQCVSGDGVPSGLFARDTVLHVVTASLPLGVPDAFPVGPRLLDYAPVEYGSHSLALDASWAAHGLRLYVPTAGHVWLYPNLRPTDVAAAKIAAAILPDPSMRREEYLFLLLPGQRGGPHFMLLRRDRFRPLSESFRWMLEVDAGQSLPVARDTLGRRITDGLCKAVADGLLHGAQAQATSRLELAIAGLRPQVAALAEELESREARLERLEKTMAAFDTALSRAQSNLGRMLDESTALDDLVGSMATDLHRTGPHLGAIRALIERHADSRREMHALIADLRRLRNEHARSRRNSP